MAAPADRKREESIDDPPPVGGSWRALYVFVLAVLAVVVVALFALTRAYA